MWVAIFACLWPNDTEIDIVGMGTGIALRQRNTVEFALTLYVAEESLKHRLEQSRSAALGRFADRWWVVFLILFGAAFVFGVPFHTPR